MTAESPDLLHTDMLRFLASVAIVVVHFRTNMLSFLAEPQRVAATLDSLALAVDIFFVISGFVISWVYGGRIATFGNFREFIVKRLARLVPLHYATLLFFILVGLAAAFSGQVLERGDKYGAECIPANLLLIQSLNVCGHASFNTVSWSISAEMLLYCAFPVLWLLASRYKMLSLVTFAAMLLLLFVLDGPGWIERTHAFGIVRALPAFLLGMIAYQFRAQLGRIPAAHLVLWAAFALFAVGIAVELPKYQLLPLAYAIALVAIAADMRGTVSNGVRRLAPFGRLTYSCYLLHPVIQSLMITVMGKAVLGLEGAALSAWTVFAIPCTLAVSYVSLFYFEDPARLLLRQRLGGRPRAKPKPVT